MEQDRQRLINQVNTAETPQIKSKPLSWTLAICGKDRVLSSPNSTRRGDRSEYPTERDDTGFGPLHPTVLRTGLPTRPGTAGGRDPRLGKTDGELGLMMADPRPLFLGFSGGLIH